MVAVARPVPAHSATSTCTGWQIVPTHALWPGGASILSGVAPAATNDVWAVGTTSVPGNIRRTLTEHWDGSEWTVMASPNVGPDDNGLTGTTAIASDDVWSVGYSRHLDGYRTLALRWDGAGWSVVSTPNGSGGNGTLASVAAAAPNDVWAVGHTSGADGVAPLVLHWNGSAWASISLPGLGLSGDAGLTGVSVRSAVDVWAVGYATTPGLRPMALHWDGSTWTRFPVPVPPGQGALAGVSVVPGGGAWAVGYRYSGTTYRTLTERWDGSAWRVVPSRDGRSRFTFLHGVVAAGGADVWAVGSSYDPVHRRFRTLSEHWNGSSWSVVGTPNYQTGRTNTLDGIALVPGTNRLWAAGVGAGHTLVETRCSGSGAAAAGPDVSLGALAGSEGDGDPGSPPPRRRGSPPTAPPATPAVTVPQAVDRAAAAGVAQPSNGWTVVTTDMNRDGWPDLFIGRHGRGARLYFNRRGVFQEDDRSAFPSADRHGCAAADVNHDGWKDIFCGMGASHGIGVKRNELEMQRADHTFFGNAVPSGLMDPFGRTRHVTFINVNHDGYPDLFVGTEVDRPDGLPAPNRFFVNNGNGTFHDAPSMGLDHQIGATSVQAFDENGDGWSDLLLATPGGLHLYRNDDGSGFTDVTAAVGLGAQASVAAQMGDLNGDGMPDLVTATSTQLTVFLGQGGRFREVFSAGLTSAIGVTLADVNGDRRPDVYVVQGPGGPNDPDLMLLNQGDGTQFTAMTVPQTTLGTGDAAYPIDFDRNGFTDLLVMNGHLATDEGPLQLLAFSAP